MAYVKTTWQTGDVITAEKLNNMEGGIEKANDMLPQPTLTDVATEAYLALGLSEDTENKVLSPEHEYTIADSAVPAYDCDPDTIAVFQLNNTSGANISAKINDIEATFGGLTRGFYVNLDDTHMATYYVNIDDPNNPVVMFKVTDSRLDILPGSYTAKLTAEVPRAKYVITK